VNGDGFATNDDEEYGEKKGRGPVRYSDTGVVPAHSSDTRARRKLAKTKKRNFDVSAAGMDGQEEYVCPRERRFSATD